MAESFNLTAQLQLQAPTNVRQVANTIQKQLGGAGNVKVKVDANTKSLARANSDMQSFAKNTKVARQQVSRLSRDLEESARRFGVITLATGTLIGFTNALKNGVKQAIEFEREVVKISQVTGKTAQQLSGLTREVDRLSVSLGANSSDLIEVSRTLLQTGLSAEKTKQALEVLAKTSLAATFDSIQDTTEGAIALLRQFGDQALSAGGDIKFLEKSLDAINAVSKKFAVESGDIITAIRKTGGVFASAGGQVEELIALFTSVRATTRESADTIATGLRTIFTRIQRVETIDQLKSLGIQLQDSQGRFVGAYKAFQRLSTGLAALDARDYRFSEIVESLGGFRQVGKVIPLIQQFTTSQDALNVALNASGSISKDAETAQQSLANKIEKTSEKFAKLLRTFTDSKAFRELADFALAAADGFIKFASSLEKVLPLITTLLAVKVGSGIAGFVGRVVGGSLGRGAASSGGYGPVSKFATGGKVLGFNDGGVVPGTGNRDTVPAMLTPGEFVIKKSSVAKMGTSQLEAMNQNRRMAGSKQKEESDELLSEQETGLNNSTISYRNDKSKIGFYYLRAGTEGDPRGPKSSLLSNRTRKDVSGSQELGFTPDTIAGSGKKSGITDATRKRLGWQKGDRIKYEFDSSVATLADEPSEQFSQKIKDGLATSLADVTNTIAKQYEVALPFSGDIQKASKKAEASITKEQVQSIEGALFENFVSSLSGAKQGSEKAGIDIPSVGSAQRQALKQISAGDIDNVNSIEVKKSYSKESYSTPSKSGTFFNKMWRIASGESNVNQAQVGMTVNQSDKNGPQDRVGPVSTAKARTKLNTGGSAGAGSPQDTIPALLTPGEFVINRDAASRIGTANLNMMNKYGVSRFNSGGSVGVQRFSGGGKAKGTARLTDITTEAGSLFEDLSNFGGEVSGAFQLMEKTMLQLGNSTEDAERKAKKFLQEINGGKPTLTAAAELIREDTLARRENRRENEKVVSKNKGDQTAIDASLKSVQSIGGGTPTFSFGSAAKGNESIRKTLEAQQKKEILAIAKEIRSVDQNVKAKDAITRAENQVRNAYGVLAKEIDSESKASKLAAKVRGGIGKVKNASVGGLVKGSGGAFKGGLQQAAGVARATENLVFLAGAAGSLAAAFGIQDEATSRAVAETTVFVTTMSSLGGTVVQTVAALASNLSATVADTAATTSNSVSTTANSTSKAGNTAATNQNSLAQKTASKSSGKLSGAMTGAAVGFAVAITALKFFSAQAEANADALEASRKKTLANFEGGKGARPDSKVLADSIQEEAELRLFAAKTQVDVVNSLGVAATAGIGAGIGAAIGSVVPVVGTAVGGLVGGIIGGFAGVFAIVTDANAAVDAGREAREKETAAIAEVIGSYLDMVSAQREYTEELQNIDQIQGRSSEEKLDRRLSLNSSTGVSSSAVRASESANTSLNAISDRAILANSQARTQSNEVGFFGSIRDAYIDAAADVSGDPNRRRRIRAESGKEFAKKAERVSVSSLAGQSKEDRIKSFTNAGYDEAEATQAAEKFAISLKSLNAAIKTNEQGVKETSKDLSNAIGAIDMNDLPNSLNKVNQALKNNISFIEAERDTKLQLATTEEERASITENANARIKEQTATVKEINDKARENKEIMNKEIAARQALISIMRSQQDAIRAENEKSLNLDNQIQELDISSAIASGGTPQITMQAPVVEGISLGAIENNLDTFERANAGNAGAVTAVDQVRNSARLRSGGQGLIGSGITLQEGGGLEAGKKLAKDSGLDQSVVSEAFRGSQQLIDEFYTDLANKAADGEINTADLDELFKPAANLAKGAGDLISKITENANKELQLANKTIAEQNAARQRNIESLNEYSSATASIAEKLAELNGTSVAKARSKSEKEAAQRKLDTGNTGLVAGDARGAGRLLKSSRQRKLEVGSELNQARESGDTDKVKSLLKELDNLNNSIRDADEELARLSTSTSELDVIQEKLSKATAAREQGFAVISDFVIGGKAERETLQSGAAGINSAIRTNTTQNLSDEQRKNTFGLLDQLSEVENVFGSGKSGKDLKQELIVNDAIKLGFDPAIAKQLATQTTTEEKLLTEAKTQTALMQKAAGLRLTEEQQSLVDKSTGQFDEPEVVKKREPTRKELRAANKQARQEAQMQRRAAGRGPVVARGDIDQTPEGVQRRLNANRAAGEKARAKAEAERKQRKERQVSLAGAMNVESGLGVGEITPSYKAGTRPNETGDPRTNSGRGVLSDPNSPAQNGENTAQSGQNSFAEMTQGLNNIVTQFSTVSSALSGLQKVFQDGIQVNHNFTGDMSLALKIENSDQLKAALGDAITPKIKELIEELMGDGIPKPNAAG